MTEDDFANADDFNGRYSTILLSFVALMLIAAGLGLMLLG
jgi:hypothetical protein